MRCFKIAFLMSNLDISGGANVIFHHASSLARAGHEVWLVCDRFNGEPAIDWHPIGGQLDRLKIRICKKENVVDIAFDIAIATHWRTVFWAWQVHAAKYVYFVQSIELRFFCADELVLRRVVEATYSLDVGFVTEARWIREYLSELYAKNAFLARNGIDKRIFNIQTHCLGPRSPAGLPRVLVEGPLGVPFKNTEKAIELSVKSGLGPVWLLTTSRCDGIEGVERVFCGLPMSMASRVYRSCDVLVKLSYVEGMFGPPLEMFHCGGTAVTYDVTGHDEYIRPGFNALVAPIGDEVKILEYLGDLLRFPELLKQLRKNAIETAAEWPDWSESSAQFATAIQDAAETSRATRSELREFAMQTWSMLDLHWRECRRLTGRERPALCAPNGVYEELQKMKTSSSWLLTEPLRALARRNPRLQQLIRARIVPQLSRLMPR